MDAQLCLDGVGSVAEERDPPGSQGGNNSASQSLISDFLQPPRTGCSN